MKKILFIIMLMSIVCSAQVINYNEVNIISFPDRTNASMLFIKKKSESSITLKTFSLSFFILFK